MLALLAGIVTFFGILALAGAVGVYFVKFVLWLSK